MPSYTKEKYDRLKYKFNGSENILENHSQAYQDMFVLTMLDGKMNGTYLEIGSGVAKTINNTYLLEKSFDWKGVSIDIQEIMKNSFIDHNRTNKIIINDALTLNYEQLFIENSFTKQIDYLQLDMEPQYNTLKCLKLIPFDKYRFSVITYETDFCDTKISREESLLNREESRKILLSYGYELIAGNVCNLSTADPFEDWYIDPSIIDKNILKLFEKSLEFNNVSEAFLLNS
jgi:hypothetical protein